MNLNPLKTILLKGNKVNNHGLYVTLAVEKEKSCRTSSSRTFLSNTLPVGKEQAGRTSSVMTDICFLGNEKETTFANNV